MKKGDKNHDCKYVKGQKTALLDLPPELLRRILGFMPFDDASNIRICSRTLDLHVKQYMNAGFKQMEQYHNHTLQIVKAQLPRRESERRNHPLARHNDILTAVETRLSLLSMTYNKYIELGLCSFIPGKVLDETGRVLRKVNEAIRTQEQPPRPHELLQELRDISSMAMEHFDEQVAPGLRDSAMHNQTTPKCADSLASMALIGALRPVYTGTSSVIHRSGPPTTSMPCRAQMDKLQGKVREQNAQLGLYKKELGVVKAGHSRTEGQLREQAKKMQQQDRVIEIQGKKLDEFGVKFKEMSMKLLEYESKFADLLSGESSSCIPEPQTAPVPRRAARITRSGTTHEAQPKASRKRKATADKDGVKQRKIEQK